MAVRRGSRLDARDRRRTRVEGLARMVECMAERLLDAASSASPSAETARVAPPRSAAQHAPAGRRHVLGRGLRISLRTRVAIVRRSRAGARPGDRTAHRQLGTAHRRIRSGIRATVIGASQYTIQVSGSTIFIAPRDAVPIRNVPAITPAMPLDAEVLDPKRSPVRFERHCGDSIWATAIGRSAICYRFRGSATFARLDAFCRGLSTVSHRYWRTAIRWFWSATRTSGGSPASTAMPNSACARASCRSTASCCPSSTSSISAHCWRPPVPCRS